MRLRPVFTPTLLLLLVTAAASARGQDESYWSAYRDMNYRLSARRAGYAAHFESASPEGVCPCGNREFHAHAAAMAGSAPWQPAAYESYASDEPYTTGEVHSAGEPYLIDHSHVPGEAAWVGYEAAMPATYGQRYGRIHAHKCRDKGPGPLWYFCHDMNVLFDSVLDDVDNLCCSVIYGFHEPCYFGHRSHPHGRHGGYLEDCDCHVSPGADTTWPGEMEGEILEPPPEPPPVDPTVAPYSSSAGASRQRARRIATRVDSAVPMNRLFAPPPVRYGSDGRAQSAALSSLEPAGLRDALPARSQTTARQTHFLPPQSTWLGLPAGERQVSASMYTPDDDAGANQGPYAAQLAEAIGDAADSGPALEPPVSPARGRITSLRIVDTREPEPTLAPVRRTDRSDDETPSTLRLFSAPPNPLRN